LLCGRFDSTWTAADLHFALLVKATLTPGAVMIPLVAKGRPLERVGPHNRQSLPFPVVMDRRHAANEIRPLFRVIGPDCVPTIHSL
jgi:hypothetical protein